MNNIRTRNAPSPTGYAHLGTIYQSLLNYSFSKRNNGRFVIRIEDTDQVRYVEGAVDAVFNAMDWLGIVPDESPKHGGEYGPYVQSERLPLYQKYAKDLVEQGHAYYCFCTTERLKESRDQQQKDGISPMYDKRCRNLSSEEVQTRLKNDEPAVIRMKIPEKTKVVVHDLIRGEIEFDSSAIDDQVLLKSDGYPTYHLAVVVDDHLMEISHTVRGAEYVTSFPKHKLLYEYFGWEMPIFVHTPMIANPDGSKLSKRQGHASVDWYRWQGFLPEALLNYISLLGWSHPDQKEIFSIEEFTQVFDLKDLSALSPKFDLEKCHWMNGQYIQALSNENFITRLQNWLTYCATMPYQGATAYESHWKSEDYSAFQQFLKSLDQEKQLLFAEMNKPRIKKFEDLLPMNEFFIHELPLDEALMSKFRNINEVKEHLKWVMELLEKSDWSLQSLKEVEAQVKNRADELGWKIIEVFYPIRMAICRSPISPPLFESMFLMGKEKALASFSTIPEIQ